MKHDWKESHMLGDEQQSRGVICLFCGARTSLPSSERRAVSQEEGVEHRGWNLRCAACGKEAMYYAHEVLDSQSTTPERARVVGMN
jgi:hypothetical protein